MKTITLFIFTLVLFQLGFSQDYTEENFEDLSDSNTSRPIGTNGYLFELLDTGVNTKFSEFGSGFFRNKFIMVSAKKLGGFAKVDKKTSEGYRNLFCVDIEEDGSLTYPILFSRLINTHKSSEDQISFSPDEHTMYFTRASKEDTSIYKLYKSVLAKNSNGNWREQILMPINLKGYSIENPHVSPEGEKLYFSSNLPNGYGGYDIYYCNIDAKGNLSNPINLGPEINTPLDEKYPSVNFNNTYMYFSSKGHANIGGFDVFKSKLTSDGYLAPINLGNTINTKYDEVAFFLASKNKGYVTSDKAFGKGRYDIYKFTMEEIIQTLEGQVVDLHTQTPLANTALALITPEGDILERQTSDKDGNYKFKVMPYETYTITSVKDGFIDSTFDFKSEKGKNTTYTKNLELNPVTPIIEVKNDKVLLVVNNIYFDYNKWWSIKDESLIQLNSIVDILSKNPEMKIEINAHTDNRGDDQYNLNLSEKRAQSVMNYLIEKGISADRLISNGYGEKQPLIDCKTNCTETEHQQNRRIEFLIINK